MTTPIFKCIDSNKVNWYYLSFNHNAIHILEQNLDKINWFNLSSNPNAIHLLEQNLDKIQWSKLSSNLNAVHILENNLDKVNWEQLSGNPNATHLLFSLDYEKMKEKNKVFFENLVQKVFNPERILKLCSIYDIEFIDYMDFF